MAKCKMEAEPKFILELSHEEAAVLLVILANVESNGLGSKQDLVNGIIETFSNVGLNWFDFDKKIPVQGNLTI